jgi:hypothetical protein
VPLACPPLRSRTFGRAARPCAATTRRPALPLWWAGPFFLRPPANFAFGLADARNYCLDGQGPEAGRLAREAEIVPVRTAPLFFPLGFGPTPVAAPPS